MNNQTQLILDYLSAKQYAESWQGVAEKEIARGNFSPITKGILKENAQKLDDALKALREMPRVADQLEYHLFGSTYATLILQDGEVVDVETARKEMHPDDMINYQHAMRILEEQEVAPLEEFSILVELAD